MRPRASQVARIRLIDKDGVTHLLVCTRNRLGGRLTVQSFSMTLINSHRRLVAPIHGSARMDTLGCGENAS